MLVRLQVLVLGLYLPPVFERLPTSSTPNDHFTAGPDCRVTVLAQWARWWCWSPSNYPCWDCIFRLCSDRPIVGASPPQTIISLPVQTAV